MPGRQPYARTIVESELVAQRIDNAMEKAPHLGELYERGLKWKLARSPASGNKIPETDFYYATTFTWSPGGVPSITVMYRFDDNNVYFESSKINWPKK